VAGISEQLVKIQKELEAGKNVLKEQKNMLVLCNFGVVATCELKKAIELKEVMLLQEKKMEEREKRNTELQFFIKYKLERVYEEIREEKRQINANISNVVILLRYKAWLTRHCQ
jgi:hypothetical protein